jgi:hypothetical protein
MKIADILETLQAALARGDPPAHEGLIVGDASRVADAILVCHSPSPEILRAAAREGRRLIIARQHPFYIYKDPLAPGRAEKVSWQSSLSWWSSGVDRLEAANDRVIAAKQRLISEFGLAIYRLSTLWDAANPKQQALALAQALAMPPLPEHTLGPHVECLISPRRMDTLARDISNALRAGPIRGMGSRKQVVARVLLIPGYIETAALQNALAGRRIDLLVAGEGCEWEAVPYLKDAIDMGLSPWLWPEPKEFNTFEYFRDASELGIPETMIGMTHELWEEWGMQEPCAHWLSRFVSEVPVIPLRTGEFYWTDA